MKKKLLLTLTAFVFALTCAFSLTACGDGGVSSVEMSVKQHFAMAGSELRLEAIVWTESGKAYKGGITWTSDAEDVASVDGDGKLTALKAGKATVTATAGGKSGECTVTVGDFSADDWKSITDDWAYAAEETKGGSLYYKTMKSTNSLRTENFGSEKLILFYDAAGNGYYRYAGYDPDRNTASKIEIEESEYNEQRQQYGQYITGLKDKFASFDAPEKVKTNGYVSAYVFNAQNLQVGDTTFKSVKVTCGYGAAVFSRDDSKMEFEKADGGKIVVSFKPADWRFNLPKGL